MSVTTGDLVPRVYTNFRGVDFRGEEINLVRSPDALNVWKDYKETESIRTRPGLALNASFNATVYGIFHYNGVLIVHSGTSLYKVVNGSKTTLFSGLNERESNAFVYENKFYFKDGKHYLVYDGNTIGEVEGYIPTTSIGRKPSGGWRTDEFRGDGTRTEFHLSYTDIQIIEDPVVKVNDKVVTNYTVDYEKGIVTFDEAPPAPEVEGVGDENISIKYLKPSTMGGGTIHEDVNMLTGIRINTFLADGESTDFYLDAPLYEGEINALDSNYAPIVKINGERPSISYTVDYHKAVIKFHSAPPAPNTDGQDNVSVQFKKTVKGYRDNILKCTLLQVFDNRVFFSGNEDYPNYVWHCSLDDPSYCSDLDYYREGLDTAAVKGLVAGNNALWVFREPSDANTTVFYHTPTIDSEYGKIYPSQHSSITTGCVGKAVNFNDDIIFFSERGMEGISGDVTTEQVLGHRSTLVDRKLTAEGDYKNMVLAEWEGYLLVFIGSKVYLADSRAMFTNENHVEYDFFYWDIGKKVTCATVKDGVLFIGTEDGVYTLTDKTSAVESYWTTPKDKFKAPQLLKTTHKRGCVAEAKGDISVYAKVEDSDFELIGTYENVTDYFVSRIKRKKFKDIQLKFHSNTRFSLETVTLECFIGGYIKR